MSIPKRVRSDKRIVWHDSSFQVYLRDNKLQYQDEKGLRHELGGGLLTYEQLMELENDSARVEELNKHPEEYYEELDLGGYIERGNYITGTNVYYSPEENRWSEMLE